MTARRSALWAALALSISVAACRPPKTPEELAERLVEAAMEGDEKALGELLNPDGRSATLSAKSLRLKYQGLEFSRAEQAALMRTDHDGRSTTLWDIELAVSGTRRRVPGLRLSIDCQEEPKKICLLGELRELDWRIDELTSVEHEMGLRDSIPRAWLMTSVDVLDPNLNLFTGGNEDLLARAEHAFRKWAHQTGPILKPVVAHLANQHELAQVLKDPRTRAVFWISHGTTGAVMDHLGFELAPVWSRLAPASRAGRFALVSCNSRGIIEPSHRVVDFDGRIDLMNGLEEAFEQTTASDLEQAGEGSVGASEPPGEPPGETIELVRRLAPSPLHGTERHATPALRIELNDQIVATLPGLKPWDHTIREQSLTIHVPLLAARAILSSGESYSTPLEEIRLGDFEILSPGWKFFTDANGKPIGVTRNILLRKNHSR